MRGKTLSSSVVECRCRDLYWKEGIRASVGLVTSRKKYAVD